MTKPTGPKASKIVDWSDAPHTFANQIIGVAAIGDVFRISLGRTEVRYENIGENSGPPVIKACGEITLTPSAAAKLLNILSDAASKYQRGNEASANRTASKNVTMN